MESFGDSYWLTTHQGYINDVLNIHFSARNFDETLVEILVLKIAESLTIQSLTMIMVQIDIGEFW